MARAPDANVANAATTTTPAERGDRRARLALLLIVALAATTRFSGLNFGLPLPYARPDENRIAGQAIAILHGDWRPASFAYPSLFPALVAGARAIGAALGFGGPLDAPFEQGYADAYLAARVVSACAGVATVLLVFAIGLRLFGATCGLVAALLLALCPLHSRDSHFGVTDATLALATTGVLALQLALRERPLSTRLLACGALLAVAASIKQPAIWAAAPLALDALLPPSRGDDAAGGRLRGSAEPLRRRLAWLALAALAAAATFLLLNPFALREPARFVEETLFELRHKTTADAPLSERGWIVNATFVLRHGLTLPVELAAFAGLVVALAGLARLRAAPLVGRRRDELLLASFALAWYLGMGSGSQAFARYMVPLAPVAALLAASFATRVVEAIARRASSRARRIALALSAAALAAPGARSIDATDALLRARDTRLLAYDWLRERLAPDERALWIGRYSAPPLDAADARIDVREGKFLVAELTSDVDPLAALAAGGYRFVVLPEPWLRSPFDAPDELARRLVAPLKEAFVASPLAPGRTRDDVAPLFDRHDFLDLPCAGLDGFERTGPFLRIWRRP